jgi:hypothetical protein
MAAKRPRAEARERIRPCFEERRPGVWLAPAEFGVVEVRSRGLFLRRLAILREMIWDGGVVCLDFSQVERIYSNGGLLFLAELRRVKRHAVRPVTFHCIYPKNNKVSQVLEQIGVFQLIGAGPGAIPADEDVVNWRFAHDNRVDGETYEDVLAQYDGDIAPELQQRLYAGITEAMTNVVNHAYDLTRDDGIGITQSREWWMFSQSKDQELTVVFADLGAGIPRTLPMKRPSLWEQFLKRRRHNDGAAIELAIKDSISRTKLGHRGKGLGQIVRAVESAPQGEMAIMSNYGAVYVRNGRHQVVDYADSILGTLIYWKLPLPTKVEP